MIAAITDLGLRFRATYPNEEMSDSGLRHLSADDIWMLELTLDVMCMLAGELAYESQRHDPEILSRSLGNIDKVTHDRHWKRALHQAGAGPAQFQQLRANIPPRTPARR